MSTGDAKATYEDETAQDKGQFEVDGVESPALWSEICVAEEEWAVGVETKCLHGGEPSGEEADGGEGVHQDDACLRDGGKTSEKSWVERDGIAIYGKRCR